MGPTASGKTRLAIELVQRLPCDIISVDSAMVYRGMDIGTAKPTFEELVMAPHRLIDICDPATPYSAGQFCQDALREIESIHRCQIIPLLVGGTMLYFHLLQHGVSDLPSADSNIREKIYKKALEKGWPAMHQRLQKLDPEAAASIHQNDSQRIQRALEIYEMTGQPLTEMRTPPSPLPYDSINLILDCENRQALHRRIENRFNHMLEHGFLEEVERLMQRGDLHPDLPSIRTVGYRQAWVYWSGKLDYFSMREQAIIATRQLAKRQRTWLRRWREAKHFSVEDPGLLDHVLTYLAGRVLD